MQIMKWFKSRTVNWGAVIAVLGFLQSNLDKLQQNIPAKYYGAAFVIVGALMVYLRVTHKPIE